MTRNHELLVHEIGCGQLCFANGNKICTVLYAAPGIPNEVMGGRVEDLHTESSPTPEAGWEW